MDSVLLQVEQQPPPAQIPLLGPNPNHTQQPQPEQESDGDDDDVKLDRTLSRLDTFVALLGFNQSTVLSIVLSWFAFLVIGVLIPVLALVGIDCDGCGMYQLKELEIYNVVSTACLSVISLVCFSHNLRKYGIRKFLFLDRLAGHMEGLQDRYIEQIKGSVRLLLVWTVPCLVLKIAREIVRFLNVRHETWLSTIILLAFIMSWIYVSIIYLAACMMFHITCNLQLIHFDEYTNMMEKESNVLVLMDEHLRLRYHLSKISHRFRIFLVLQCLFVTISQVITLFLTTSYGDAITFINGGDVALSSLVQVVGMIICLQAATRISHRAQNVASIASRWHAFATSGATTSSSRLRNSKSVENMEAARTLNSLHHVYSELDLESMDYASVPTSLQTASYVSSYHTRQAFVQYLGTNPGGITMYGWTVDRGLLNTIFFIELTLITFVLGNTTL